MTPVAGAVAQPVGRPPTIVARPTILLVEDERDLVTALTTHLETQGFAVVAAADGMAGLAAAREAAPQLILLDLMLPGLDGYRVLKHLKTHEQYQRIPIVVTTARAGSRDLELAFEAGADACLVKPVQGETLLATIRMLLAPPASE